jgi:hypothetical protein
MPIAVPEPSPFDVALTRNHLDASIERNCTWCAVARAVSEAVGSNRFVSVAADGRIHVRRHFGGRHFEATVDEPARVAEIVRLVDAGRGDAVDPTTFRIWCPFRPEEDC